MLDDLDTFTASAFTEEYEKMPKVAKAKEGRGVFQEADFALKRGKLVSNW